jgi:hypothetical protein
MERERGKGFTILDLRFSIDEDVGGEKDEDRRWRIEDRKAPGLREEGSFSG